MRLKRFFLALVLVAIATPAFAQQAVTLSGMKAEDDTATDKDKGVVLLVKRCDTASSSASADGKYAVLCSDANGNLRIAVGNGSLTDASSVAVTTSMATTLATGAATECPIVSLASTNATNCKSSAGNFYGYELYNTTTTVYCLRLYNLASAPTASSATGWIRSIPIPPASSAGLVGGIVALSPIPVNYTVGIGYVITGGCSSTDNTNAASGIYGKVLIK